MKLLAGPANPGEYAQAATTLAAQVPIGRVEKVSGSATAVRNGVFVELHLGDPVLPGDVLQTSSDSGLTIKFNDGSVFGLSASARIILNEMIYTPASTSSSALLTLVQGTIGFIAGKIAKTGDLKIETPVATMAIRGTAVQTEIAADTGTTKFSLMMEPDGKVGSFLLLDKFDPTRVIATMSDAAVSKILSPSSSTGVQVIEVPKSGDDIRGENAFVRELFNFFALDQKPKGGSDFDILKPIPINAPGPAIDDVDLPRFALAPLSPDLGGLRQVAYTSTVQLPTSVTRGAAFEDGPLASLGALSGSLSPVLPATTAAPAFVLQGPLPPGVTYSKSSPGLILDPSHPSFQYLAAGQKATITVQYELDYPGFRVPVRASWVVTGQNDQPIAKHDSFVGAGEGGSFVVPVLANDSDLDGDKLHVTSWTAPEEGTLTLDPSGQLVFRPGRAFETLSAGETATVSFAYTVSDLRGGTDQAAATIQIKGAGQFSAPLARDEAGGTLAFNDQDVDFQISAPSRTTSGSAQLDLSVHLGPVTQPGMNLLYLVDVSNSTRADFSGPAIGDVNGDGLANTVLDAEIQCLIGLTGRIKSLGFSPEDVTVTVIPFNGRAGPADESGHHQDEGNTQSATFNLNDAGIQGAAGFLRGLDAGGSTNYEAALRAALDTFGTLDKANASNIVYFVSDGGGSGRTSDEVSMLEDRYGAKIAAYGIGSGVDLARLDAIDNTGGAAEALSASDFDLSFLGAPVPEGRIADVDVFVNGKELQQVGPEDLIAGQNGFNLKLPLSGLARTVGQATDVTATIRFAGGETFETSLRIAGALPSSTDFVI